MLGHDKAAELLQETLDEEGDADHKLTEIAQSLNIDAENADEMEEDEAPPGKGRRKGRKTMAAGRA